MYLSDDWSFLVELEAYPGETPATVGVVPVDLSQEEYRGDVEPYRHATTRVLHCNVGKNDERVGDEVRRVARVWEYRGEEQAFNRKFPLFRQITVAEFVGRLLDANREFDGFTDEEVEELKEEYGV